MRRATEEAQACKSMPTHTASLPATFGTWMSLRQSEGFPLTMGEKGKSLTVLSHLLSAVLS